VTRRLRMGILAIAWETQGGSHLDDNRASSRARSQAEKMINLHPTARRVPAWEDANEWGQRRIRMQYRLPWRGQTASTTPSSDPLAIAGVTATGAARRQDYPSEIASPLVFLAPDESPQLVHGLGACCPR
jgi:hypothetical protein